MQNRDKCKQKPTEIILFEQPGYQKRIDRKKL